MHKKLFIGMSMILTTIVQAQTADFVWSELEPIPDAHGFAGSFAGTSQNALIVAGGANFPDGGAPWTGSKKAWTNQVFVLDQPNGKWKLSGNLPTPLGYGVSAAWNDQLICAGGSSETGHHREVFALSLKKDRLIIDTLPPMPYTLANSSGAIAGDILYVAGGLVNPDDRHCSTVFMALDLSVPYAKLAWKVLDTWPGPARMLATSGAIGNIFYLFSGAELIDSGNGTSKRRYLHDAYSYTPAKGWTQLADMPWPAVAAPGPAYATGEHTITIFGGDTGELAELSDLKEHHPGFNVQILKYDVEKNSWRSTAKIPADMKTDRVSKPNESLWAPVTVPTVSWRGKLIFPGGEVRPAVRTPRVRVATPFGHNVL